MPINAKIGVLASTSGKGAKVQQIPNNQARALTQIQRRAVGIAVRSSRYCAVGMDNSSAAPRTAATSHVARDDQGTLGIELGSSPIDQATAAAALVTTGQWRRIRGGSCSFLIPIA
jgi:hypothetical protein